MSATNVRLHPAEGVKNLPSYQQYTRILIELTRLGLYDKDYGWKPESQTMFRSLLENKFGLDGDTSGFIDGDGI